MNITPRIQDVDFDSTLHIPSATAPVNCELTLQVSIYLDRIGTNRFHYDGRSYRTRRWTNAEWNEFVFLYRHTSEHYWNNRFWLVPPRTFSDMDLPLARPAYRPNVKCKLALNIVRNQADDHHVRIRAVHLAENEHRFFRSDSETYCQRDINPDTTDPHHIQITVVHEVGHLIGIDHPGVRHGDAACVADGNADECYAGDELMGLGMAFPDEYAQPWRLRIARHTHTRAADWAILRQDAPPRLLARGAGAAAPAPAGARQPVGVGAH